MRVRRWPMARPRRAVNGLTINFCKASWDERVCVCGCVMRDDQRPVFAPPERSDQPRIGQRPVDLVQLASQTGGDRALEEEVLRLFLRQAGAIGKAMRQQTAMADRKRAAHTLKGAARAIGAGAIAETALAVEQAPGEPQCVTALLKEIDTACDYIHSLLR